MSEKRLFLKIIKVVFLVLIFYMAVYFENALGNRLYILVAIFTTYIGIGLLRSFMSHDSKLLSWSFLIDIALVYLLEHNSRFIINYFFHSFYIVILLEVSLTLKRDKSLVISVISVGVSLVKYVALISYKSNLANLSQLAFFLMLNTLILFIANFAQYNKEEKEKKDLLYGELLKTHKKLREYSARVEELAVIEERNRIARDIHDTLGHNMTALIMQMEMSSHIMDDETEKAKELIESAKLTARQGLVSIRKVVETLRGEEKGMDSIKELVNEFCHASGVKGSLEVTGKPVRIDTDTGITLYRVIQESLTNSVRHGNATNINVELTYTSEKISFVITDNGIGTKTLKEGYGLKGMKERVQSLKGEVEFKSHNGFVVKGWIPVK